MYVYYQIIYAAIRYSIESGAKLLMGGGGAYELKRRLGFSKLPDDYMMVAANGQLLGWLFHRCIPFHRVTKYGCSSSGRPGRAGLTAGKTLYGF